MANWLIGLRCLVRIRWESCGQESEGSRIAGTNEHVCGRALDYLSVAWDFKIH